MAASPAAPPPVPDEHGDNGEAQRRTHKASTPLPWTQLSVVLLMRLAEPVAFSLIFPFIGDMIWDLRATGERGDVGMYAGIVVSARASLHAHAHCED